MYDPDPSRIDLSLDPPQAREPVYFGGPVQRDRGFVLHQPVGNWSSTVTARSSRLLTTPSSTTSRSWKR